MKYHFKIHKEKNGYWAQGIELPGCFTQADTMQELQVNMHEALNLYVEEPEDSADLAALPNDSIKKTKNVVSVPLDPRIAFSFLIRYSRIKHGLTQRETAKKMGLETIDSYQKLEAGRCNPNLVLMSKIKKVFPEFSIDYAVSQ